MSDGNKTIKLGVAFDDVGFRRFKSALREVTSEAAQAFQTLNRSSLAAVVGGNALPGQWGSGGFQQRSGVNSQVIQATKANPLTGGMVQGLQQQQNALKIIASGSKEAMKAMVDATKNAIGDQKRELDSLSKTIDQLGRRYNELSKAASELRSKGVMDMANVKSNFATGVAQTMLQNAGALGAGQQTLESLEKTLSTLEKAITGAGGAGRPPPGSGGRGGGSSDDPPSKRSAYETAMTLSTGLKAAGHVVSGGAGMFQHWKTTEAVNRAATMGLPNQLLGEFMAGDFRSLLQLGKGSGARILDQYGGNKLAAAGMLGDVATGIGGGIANTALMFAGGGAGALAKAGSAGRNVVTATERINAGAGAAGGFLGALDAAHGLYSRGDLVAEMNTLQTGINAERAGDPLQERALDLLQATAPSRVRAAKALRGRHLGAWGIGGGYGLDMGESFGAAESLARRFGIDQTMGGGGTKGKLLKSVDHDLRILTLQEQNALAGYSIGAQAAGQGITPEAMQATQAFYAKEREAVEKRGDVYSDGTRGKRSLLSMVLEAEQRGFSREGAGQIIGTLSQQGGQEQGWEKFKKAVAEGFSRGIKDSNFLEAIAQAAATAAVSPGGLNTGLASHVSSFISAGVDLNMGRHGVDAAIAGAQGGNNLFSQNPFFKTALMTAGLGAMGGASNGLGIRAIQQTPLVELAQSLRMTSDEQLSPHLRDSGVTLGQAQGAAKGALRTMFQTQLGGDPAINEILRKHQDPVEAIRAMKDAKLLGRAGSALFAKQDGTFGSKDAADAFLRSVGGLGEAEAKVAGNLPRQSGDAAAQGTVAAQQKVLQELLKKESEIMPQILENVKSIDKIMEHLKTASEDFANPNSGKTFLVKVIQSFEGTGRDTPKPSGPAESR